MNNYQVFGKKCPCRLEFLLASEVMIRACRMILRCVQGGCIERSVR